MNDRTLFVYASGSELKYEGEIIHSLVNQALEGDPDICFNYGYND